MPARARTRPPPPQARGPDRQGRPWSLRSLRGEGPNWMSLSSSAESRRSTVSDSCGEDDLIPFVATGAAWVGKAGGGDTGFTPCWLDREGPFDSGPVMCGYRWHLTDVERAKTL